MAGLGALLTLSGLARAATPIPATFHGGLVLVRAAIGDGPAGVFLLDTGAPTTVLDARFAAAAKVKLGDPIRLRGGGGAADARQAEDVRLTLAGGLVALIDPSVVDLGRVDRGTGLPLDGILGDDVLRRYVVTLDYRDATVSFSTEAAPPPADAVPMRLVAAPFVAAQAEKDGRQARGMFQIDTGSNTAVEFWRPFAQAAFPQAQGAAGAGLGIAGATRSMIGRVDALTVAGRRIVSPQVNFADQTLPDDAGPDYGGVIGGPAWSGLALTLDFLHQRVWVR